MKIKIDRWVNVSTEAEISTTDLAADICRRIADGDEPMDTAFALLSPCLWVVEHFPFDRCDRVRLEAVQTVLKSALENCERAIHG